MIGPRIASWTGKKAVLGNTAPVNTILPGISGTAQDGQTLSCSAGVWTGTPTITFAYQWKRNGVNIATGASYLLVTADVGAVMTCAVTATNGFGSATATSAGTAPVIAAGAGGGDGLDFTQAANSVWLAAA